MALTCKRGGSAAEFCSELPLVILECILIGCLCFFLIGFTVRLLSALLPVQSRLCACPDAPIGTRSTPDRH
eukprot:1982073-Rhodomonas_salina.1